MRFFRHLFHTLAAPVLLMPCATARAAGSLGDMSDSVRGEIAKFGPALKAGFALAGFFLVGLGLWQLYSLSQQPGRPKAVRSWPLSSAPVSSPLPPSPR